MKSYKYTFFVYSVLTGAPGGPANLRSHVFFLKAFAFKTLKKVRSTAQFILSVGLIGLGFFSSGAEKTVFDPERGFFSAKKGVLPLFKTPPPLSEEGLEKDPLTGTANSNAALFSDLTAAKPGDENDREGVWEKKSSPKEVLNAIHDVAADIQANSKADYPLFSVISLREKLEEEILTDNLTFSQVIDRLRGRIISGGAGGVFMREAEIKMMRGLLKLNTPSPSEALQTVDILSLEFTREKPGSYAMEAARELLEGHVFPNQESLDPDSLREALSQVLYRLERNLFSTQRYARETAKEMMISLFGRDVISSSEKRRIFLRVAGRVNGLSWERKATALDFLYKTLSQGVPLDPGDVERLAHQSLQWIVNKNRAVREGGVQLLHALFKQGLLTDSEERRKTAFAMVERLKDEVGRVRKGAYRTLKTFLSQEGSSDSDKLEVFQKITPLIFDERGYTGALSAKLVRRLLESAFPFSKKITIRSGIVERLPHASNGKRKAVSVLSFSIRQGLPADFDLFNEVVDLVSEPLPLGVEAEFFIERFLKDSGLSDEERLIISLERDQRISNRNILAQFGLEGEQVVRRFLKEVEISRGEILEIRVSPFSGDDDLRGDGNFRGEINPDSDSADDSSYSGAGLYRDNSLSRKGGNPAEGEERSQGSAACHQVMSAFLVIERH